MKETDELRAALFALENERVESVRLRRRLLDMLYNLDEENMPVIVERLRTAERTLSKQNAKLALLLSEDGESISPDALADAINEAGGLSLLLGALALSRESESISLAPDALQAVRTDKSHPPVTYTYTLTLTPDALSMRALDGESIATGDTLTLSPRGLQIPYLRRKATGATSGLYPLYIDKSGNIIATLP